MLQLIAKQPQLVSTESLREGSYAAIGAIIRCCPAPFVANLAIPKGVACVDWFPGSFSLLLVFAALMSALSREPANSLVRLSLRAALFEMAPAYAVRPDESAQQLLELVAAMASVKDADVQSVAARWCRESFPFANATSKAIALSLTAQDNLQVAGEARQALNPKQLDSGYPPFASMLQSVLALTAPESVAGTAAPPAWHEGAIRFVWRCLATPSDFLALPESARASWDQLLWNAASKANVVSALPSLATQFLLDTICLAPRALLHGDRCAEWVQRRWSTVAQNSWAGSTRADGRPINAALAAVVHAALSPSNPQLLALVDACLASLQQVRDLPVDRMCSAVALAALLASAHPNPSAASEQVYALCKRFSSHSEPAMVAASFAAMAELARRGGLSDATLLQMSALATDALETPLAKAERTVSDAAVQCMSAVCLGVDLVRAGVPAAGETRASLRSRMVDSLLKTVPVSPLAELSWIGGEALAIAFAGWDADCAQSPYWKWFEASKERTSSTDPAFVRQVLAACSSLSWSFCC